MDKNDIVTFIRKEKMIFIPIIGIVVIFVIAYCIVLFGDSKQVAQFSGNTEQSVKSAEVFADSISGYARGQSSSKDSNKNPAPKKALTDPKFRKILT